MARYRARQVASNAAPQEAVGITVEGKEQEPSPTKQDQEIADFLRQHPITCAIFERCSELTRDARSKPVNSAERKRLDRRHQKLFGCVDPRLYASSEEERENFLRSFESSLIEGQIRWQGRVTNWEDRKQIMSDLAKNIAKRPVGNQVEYRTKVTEALEMRQLNPDWTWQKIADALKLQIPLEDLKRQINILKKLLSKEEIISSPPSA